MFKKILVPVDGSAFSFRAVKTAASLAEKYGSEVTLLYVVTMPFTSTAVSPEVGVIIPQHIFDELEAEGHKILAQAATDLSQAVVKTQIRTGHPAMEIIDEAKNGYNLIVMGSRGLGELRGFVMGSVSDRVTHHSGCTVMVVH